MYNALHSSNDVQGIIFATLVFSVGIAMQTAASGLALFVRVAISVVLPDV